MSIVRRKALVNYKVNYTTVFGYPGFYECTKLMWCDMFGNVTENTLDTWTDVLEDEADGVRKGEFIKVMTEPLPNTPETRPEVDKKLKEIAKTNEGKFILTQIRFIKLNEE